MNVLTKIKSMSRYKLGAIIAAIVAAIFIILNIVLLTTPVFKGTYVYRDSESKTNYNIRFYDNTYTYSIRKSGSIDSNFEYGFYSYVPKYLPLDVEFDSIVCTEMVFERNSVFSLSIANSDNTYYCAGAICLQVFYGIVILAGAVITILLIKKEKKRKQHSEFLTQLNELKKDE